VIKRCQRYCEEALAFFVKDGLARKITVTVFSPRMGWLVAIIKFALNDGSRTLRIEFDDARQVWHLVGEGFVHAV
jgi:phage gp46-like protein